MPKRGVAAVLTSFVEPQSHPIAPCTNYDWEDLPQATAAEFVLISTMPDAEKTWLGAEN
jgi:hypothetical protein